MAAHRHELSAQLFARRRRLAAFLGSDAPRPLRALVPGMLLGAVAVAACGGYGLLRPSAPRGWQRADAVLVDRETTTRYVMRDGVLHPVLNLASARLLLGVGSGVEYVADAVLDAPGIRRGPTLGVPFAPDSLPSADDAGTPKTWAACERPGGPRRLLVLDRDQAGAVSGPGRLRSDQALYVAAPGGAGYLVDPLGRAHRLVAAPKDARRLALAVFGASAGRPQPVSAAWLGTLSPGDPVTLPRADIPAFGRPYAGPDPGGRGHRLGDLLVVAGPDGADLHFVLLADGPHPLNPFTLGLVRALHGNAAEYRADPYQLLDAAPAPAFEEGRDWPRQALDQVNAGGPGGSDGPPTVCSVLGPSGPGLWVGPDLPLAAESAGASVYVTPGTGLLLRTPDGRGYLLTDIGLRYPVRMNPDQEGDPGSGDADDSLARLGYGRTGPVAVPSGWAGLVPLGPELSRAAAERQPGL